MSFFKKIISPPPFLLPDWAKSVFGQSSQEQTYEAPPPFLLPDWAKSEFEQPQPEEPENPLLMSSEKFWTDEANS